ncbi:MAG: integrin alpha [Cyanobacteria bacterium J06648_11]
MPDWLPDKDWLEDRARSTAGSAQERTNFGTTDMPYILSYPSFMAPLALALTTAPTPAALPQDCGDGITKTISLTGSHPKLVGVSIDGGIGNFVNVVGDLDGNGVQDIAVSSLGGSVGNWVFVVTLSPDGSPLHVENLNTATPFLGQVLLGGSGLQLAADLGDLDGDSNSDLIGGSPWSDEFYTILLSPVTPTEFFVLGAKKFSAGDLGLSPTEASHLGYSFATMGGSTHAKGTEVAVGIPRSELAGIPNAATGAIAIVDILPSQQIARVDLIYPGSPGFDPNFTPNARFGSSVVAIGDLDANGVTDLVVGAPGENQFGPDTGALYLLLLQRDQSSGLSVLEHFKIPPFYVQKDAFFAREYGESLGLAPDIDGNGIADLVVGGQPGGDGFEIALLGFDDTSQSGPQASLIGAVRISTQTKGVDLSLVEDSQQAPAFASAVGGAFDYDGDGVIDVLVGESKHSDPLAPGLGSFGLVSLSSSPVPFIASEYVLSAGSGGVSQFRIEAGSAAVGGFYWILGSLSGSVSQISLGEVPIPLSLDAYLLFTLQNPNSGLLPFSFGPLDAMGSASASFVLPAGAPLGINANHAYVAFSADLQVLCSSCPLPLTTVP